MCKFHVEPPAKGAPTARSCALGLGAIEKIQERSFQADQANSHLETTLPRNNGTGRIDFCENRYLCPAACGRPICPLTSIDRTNLHHPSNRYFHPLPSTISRRQFKSAAPLQLPTLTLTVELALPLRATIKITFVPFRAINVRLNDPIFTPAREASDPLRFEISKINSRKGSPAPSVPLSLPGQPP